MTRIDAINEALEYLESWDLLKTVQIMDEAYRWPRYGHMAETISEDYDAGLDYVAKLPGDIIATIEDYDEGLYGVSA